MTKVASAQAEKGSAMEGLEKAHAWHATRTLAHTHGQAVSYSLDVSAYALDCWGLPFCSSSGFFSPASLRLLFSSWKFRIFFVSLGGARPWESKLHASNLTM